MARIRTIKPEFWKHEALSTLPEATILLAVALLNYADDEGYFNANPKLIQAECCPLREPSVPVPVSLRELSSVGYLELGKAADGRCYGRIVNFGDHQVINKPKKSKISDLEVVWEEYRTSTVLVLDEYRQEQGTGNREQGRERGKVEREKKNGFQDEFLQTFWPRYPHKVAKPFAFTSFLKAREKAALDEIMAGLERYILDKPLDQKWCNPSTWLNQERWADKPAAVVDAPKLSRTQIAINKLRNKYGNDIITGGPRICGEDRQLPPVQLPPAGPVPRSLRRAVGDAVCREAETIAPVDDQPS